MKKFARKRETTPSGHGIASPSHNRVDSVRDESVFNSINTDTSAWQTVSGTQTRAPSRDSKFRISLKERTFGGTSEALTLMVDPRQKANGGMMAGCINGDYEKDFVMEAMLNDRRFQERKAVKRSYDYNRGTKTTELRNATAKRKLKILREKEKLAFAPEKTHQLGTVPQFYPMVKINRMLNEGRS